MFSAVTSILIFILLFIIIYYRRRIFLQISLLLIFVSACFVVILNEPLNNFIVNIFFRTDTGTSGRSAIWEVGFQILDHTSWLFGIGYLTSTTLITNMGFPHQFHSFYIETLVGGGIADLILHFIIFIFVLSKINIILRKDKVTGILFLSSYFALLFYVFFESASFFSIGYVDSIFRIFFITIPLMYSNYIRNEYKKLLS